MRIIVLIAVFLIGAFSLRTEASISTSLSFRGGNYLNPPSAADWGYLYNET